MKLYYYADPAGNFGDDLNAWIWPQLIPGLLDDDETSWLIGIGTLLNHRLPKTGIKHVLGSGFGYGNLPEIDNSFRFHAVRGFKTAEQLGLPKSCVVTDSAVLTRLLAPPAIESSRFRVSAIFTGHTLKHFDWESVCDRADINYISCHWNVERVLRDILASDLVLAEAMHGAIIADALRIPWIPIACSEQVLPFKWQDWLSSLNMTYKPQRITSLHGRYSLSDMGHGLKASIKRVATKTGYWSRSWGERPLPPSDERSVRQAILDLSRAATLKPMLSDATLLDSHTHRLMECLAHLTNAKFAR